MEENEKVIKAVLDSSSIFNEYFTIKWRMLDACNYRCSYCIRNARVERREEEVLSTEEYCKIAEDIASFANNINEFDEVKIMLIGGEPSLLELNIILTHIFNNTNKVKTIHMTTNLFENFEYYKEIYQVCNDNNCRFNITASFHNEFADINEYFNKILLIKEFIKNMKGNINCEIVHRVNNTDIVEDFKQRCISNNLEYKIEEDLLLPSFNDIRTSNMIKSKKYYRYDKETNNLYWSKEEKDGYKLCDGRYLVIYDDGETESIPTRNELFSLKNTDIFDGYTNQAYVHGKFYCTDGYSFIDINKDKISCCKYNHKIDIRDFKPIDLKNTLCTLCIPKIENNYEYGAGICTFCGSLSLSDDYSFFKYREEDG